MRKVNNKAAKVLATLTAGLTPGDGRKIDNSGGTYMPVHVDCVAPNLFSVAHTYIQNGDVMDDPSMTFFLHPNGNFYPCDYTQHGLGIHQVSMTATPKSDGSFEYKGRWRLQKDHAVFAGTWMKNIKSQQDSLTATN